VAASLSPLSPRLGSTYRAVHADAPLGAVVYALRHGASFHLGEGSAESGVTPALPRTVTLKAIVGQLEEGGTDKLENQRFF